MKAPQGVSPEARLSLDRDSQQGWQSALASSMSRDSGAGTEQVSSIHKWARDNFTKKALDFVKDFDSLKNTPEDRVIGVAARVFDEMFKNGGNSPEREGAALFEVKTRLLRGESAPAPERTPEVTHRETRGSVEAVYREPAAASEPDSERDKPADTKKGEPEDSKQVLATPKQAAVGGNLPPTVEVAGVSPEIVADMKEYGHSFNGVGGLESTSGGPEWERLSDSLRAPRVTLEAVKDAFKDAVKQGANPQWLLDGLNGVKQTSVREASSLEELLTALEEAHKAGLNLTQYEDLMASADVKKPATTPEDVVAVVTEKLRAGALPEDLIRAIRGNGHGF